MQSIQKIISISAIVASICIVPNVFAMAGAGGLDCAASGVTCGTDGNEWLIETCDQLQWMDNMVSFGSGNADQSTQGSLDGTADAMKDDYYKLTSDIDWDNCVGNFQPIGNFNEFKFFEGDLNGDGKVISNLVITSNEGGVSGLFADNQGDIHDLSVVNANISGTSVSGIVTAFLYGGGNIDNVYATGTVSATSTAGGIAGFMNGASISNSYAEVTVSVSSGVGTVGGVTGALQDGSSVTDSYSNSVVSGSTASKGGLSGSESGVGNSITASFYNSDTTNCGGTCADFGTSDATTAELQDQSFLTTAGWDFTGVWQFVAGENNGYPVLQSQGLGPMTAVLAEAFSTFAAGLAATNPEAAERIELGVDWLEFGNIGAMEFDPDTDDASAFNSALTQFKEGAKLIAEDTAAGFVTALQDLINFSFIDNNLSTSSSGTNIDNALRVYKLFLRRSNVI